jgi:hypothetical protein
MNRLKESYAGCMNCGGKVKMKSGGKWIQSAIKKPGSFTAQANKAGMSVPAFRNKVLSNKSAYSATTVKRANLAKTLAGMRKGEDGMLNSKKSFADPMSADLQTVKPVTKSVTKSVTKPGMSAAYKQEQNEMMAMSPRVKAIDPLNLGANTDLNKSIGKPLSPQQEKVKSYQQMLVNKGYKVSVDGAWGPETQKAYESYIKSKTMSPSKADMTGNFKPKFTTPKYETSKPAYQTATGRQSFIPGKAGDMVTASTPSFVNKKPATLANYSGKNYTRK